MPEIILKVSEDLGLVMLLSTSKTGLKGIYMSAKRSEFKEHTEVGQRSKEVI